MSDNVSQGQRALLGALVFAGSLVLASAALADEPKKVDPTALPRLQQSDKSDQDVSGGQPSSILQSIVIHGKDAHAVINGTRLAVGDSIDGATVTAIEKSRIQLRQGDSSEWVALFAPVNVMRSQGRGYNSADKQPAVQKTTVSIPVAPPKPPAARPEPSRENAPAGDLAQNPAADNAPSSAPSANPAAQAASPAAAKSPEPPVTQGSNVPPAQQAASQQPVAKPSAPAQTNGASVQPPTADAAQQAQKSSYGTAFDRSGRADRGTPPPPSRLIDRSGRADRGTMPTSSDGSDSTDSRKKKAHKNRVAE